MTIGQRLASWSVNLLICCFALFPILWGLSTSLKSSSDILSRSTPLVPTRPTLEHYRTLLRSGIEHYTLNSVIVTACAVVACLALGMLAAYALARFRIRGHATVMFLIIAVMCIPLPSLTIPTFAFLSLFGLTDSLLGLVLLYTAYQLPITVWMLYSYIRTIPAELDAAAMVDGYGRLAVLRKVILPLSGPGLVAAGLFVLTFAWNDFVVAVTMTSSIEARTLPLAIYDYQGFAFGREWGPLMASAMVSIVPMIIVFILFQRYFLSGMTGGSVKG